MSAFGVGSGSVSPGLGLHLADGVGLLATGVGPAPAGIAIASRLACDPPELVLSVGVAGSYEGVGPELLGTVLATRSVFGDHGVEEPAGFRDLAAMGFPSAEEGWDRPDPRVASLLGDLADASGPIATVAACSGRADRATELAKRTGAVAEAMEGAAAALACHRFGVPFAELRVISNIVGDRAQHPWRLDEALSGVGRVAKLAVERLQAAGWSG